MEGPRAPTERELPNIYDFLNTNLRPNATWSIASEYPTALSPSNLGNIRIITDGNHVLSHAVLKPLIIKTPSAILKIGAIGSVVTDSQKRGQGLSSQILNACIDEAKKQDCDIAMLWTNLYDFYRKLNFELAGIEESICFDTEFTANTAGLRFVSGTKVSPEAIHRLYSQHTVGSVRNLEDIRKFLSIPNTHLYTAWDVQGNLAAYAVEGKGADLTNYIHEWGGSVTRLLALFSHIRKEKKNPVTVIVGSQSQNLLSALKAVPGAIYNEGYLGMIKLVNEENLFGKINRAGKRLGIADLVLEKAADCYRIGAGQDVLEFTDEKDMVKILFGPLPELPNLKPETVQTIEKILPLHLWIWGWDSI